MAEPVLHSITLISKKQLTSDVVELRFDRPAGFVFQPGQFVQFRVPEGEKFLLRSYSISSADNDPHLEFAVKLLPDGKASRLFFALKPGDKVIISQARGLFVVKPEHSGKHVFIVTGTGLAPVMSMLRSHVPKTAPVAVPLVSAVSQGTTVVEQTTLLSQPSFELIFGVRFKEDLFWTEQLQTLGQAHQHFTYQVTVSRPENWSGLPGRVTNYLTVFDQTAHYYVCGSLEMVKDIRTMLQAANVSLKNVHCEIF